MIRLKLVGKGFMPRKYFVTVPPVIIIKDEILG